MNFQYNDKISNDLLTSNNFLHVFVCHERSKFYVIEVKSIEGKKSRFRL